MPPPSSDQISYYADEKFDDRVIMTGNYFFIVLRFKATMTILNPGFESRVI